MREGKIIPIVEFYGDFLELHKLLTERKDLARRVLSVDPVPYCAGAGTALISQEGYGGPKAPRTFVELHIGSGLGIVDGELTVYPNGAMRRAVDDQQAAERVGEPADNRVRGLALRSWDGTEQALADFAKAIGMQHAYTSWAGRNIGFLKSSGHRPSDAGMMLQAGDTVVVTKFGGCKLLKRCAFVTDFLKTHTMLPEEGPYACVEKRSPTAVYVVVDDLQ